MLWFFFFFSSRRRHTRFDCDWSSDVCSSDLGHARVPGRQGAVGHQDPQRGLMGSRPPGMPLVAANWKMNPTNIDDALDLVRGVMSVARGQADKVEGALFPPFLWLTAGSEVLL